MSAEIPSQFSHDVKFEETAKGLRIHVHVYANKGIEAMEEAFALYQTCRDKAEILGIQLAPIEVKK
jgi:hypothetical protein